MLVSGDYFLSHGIGPSFQADVSESLAKLQAERLAADKVLQEMTSLKGCQDADGLRDYLQNAQLKVEVRHHVSFFPNLAHIDQMSQDEVKRLTGKLTRAVYLYPLITSLTCT